MIHSLAPEREEEGETGVDEPSIDSPEDQAKRMRHRRARTRHRRACPPTRSSVMMHTGNRRGGQHTFQPCSKTPVVDLPPQRDACCGLTTEWDMLPFAKLGKDSPTRCPTWPASQLSDPHTRSRLVWKSRELLKPGDVRPIDQEETSTPTPGLVPPISRILITRRCRYTTIFADQSSRLGYVHLQRTRRR